MRPPSQRHNEEGLFQPDGDRQPLCGKGRPLGMGCDPGNSPCKDDPSTKSPSLSSWDWVDGNLIATDPLGVSVHNGYVAENVVGKAAAAVTPASRKGSSRSSSRRSSAITRTSWWAVT